MDQVDAVHRTVSALPEGILKRHFQRAVAEARELLAQGAPAPQQQQQRAPAPAAHAPPAAAPAPPPRDLVGLAQAHLRLATACPPLRPASLLGAAGAAAALTLLVHTAILQHAGAALACTGAHDTPPGEAFAAPHRALPPTVFLPPGLDADAAAGSFWLRYRRHAAGRLGDATLYLHAALSASGQVLRLEARTDRSLHGGGPQEASLELSLERYTSGGEGGGAEGGAAAAAAAAAGGAAGAAALAALVARRCAPLRDAHLSERLQDDLDCQLLAPLLGAGIVGAAGGALEGGSGSGSGGGGGGLLRAPHAHGGPAFFGIPQPLTGRAPGDFDGDLWPSAAGAEPGGALAGGLLRRGPHFPGSQVGPEHPLFGGLGAGAAGGGEGLPLGVPPGARFDPMGPALGGGVGRGGGAAGRGALGPGPDHLRPPPFNDDFM